MVRTRSAEYRWVVLATAFLGVFGALGFGRFGYSAILPSMQADLDISSAAAGSLASWNLAGYTIMAAAGGILATRFGPRKVIAAGIAATALGMMLTGLSRELGAASLARLLTGIGNGMVLVPSVTLMASWFDARRLGLASTLVTTGSSLAIVLVGLAVPRIISAGGADGWRLAWYFFAGITILLALLSALVQRDRPHDPAPKPLEIKLDRSAPLALRDRMRPPALDLKLILRSGYAWHLGVVYMLYGVGFLVYFTFFQKRLTSDLGLTGETAGYLFLVVGVAGLFGGILWGNLSDRIGRRYTIALALIACGIAAVLFAATTSVASLAISALLFGSAGPVLPGLVGVACAEKYGTRLASASLGFVTILVGLGQTIGPYLGGLMGDAFGSLAPTYYFSCALFIAGAIGAIAMSGGRPAGADLTSDGRPYLPVRHPPRR